MILIAGFECATELHYFGGNYRKRNCLRRSNKISLGIINTQSYQGIKFCCVFNSLRDSLVSNTMRYIQHRPHELPLLRVDIYPANKMPVNFYVVGTQFTPYAQTSVTGAEVIQCYPKPLPSEMI